MSLVFGADNADKSVASSSYINNYTKTLILQADKRYVVGPAQVITIPTAAANASFDIQTAVQTGKLQELHVYNAIDNNNIVDGVAVSGDGSVNGPTGTSAGGSVLVSQSISDLQQNTLGGFPGLTQTSDGYWQMLDGNRILYANSQSYAQPAAGPTSVVTFGAVMRRTSDNLGSMGFALYTNGLTSDTSFTTGYLIHFEITGYVAVYKLVDGVWDVLSSDLNTAYPINTNWNTYQVVVTQSVQGQLVFNVYFGGVKIHQAVDLNQAWENGTVGFSAAKGCPAVYIQPDSFSFAIGPGAYETQPLSTQTVISIDGQYNASLAQDGTYLPQGNTDPAIVWGAAVGSSKNLVPDSGFKWGGVFWNYSFSGSMHILNGVGVNGGNGTVYTSPPGSPSTSGNIFFNQSSAVATPVQASQLYTLSGSIDARAVTFGSPYWAVMTPDLSVELVRITQVPGGTGLLQKTFSIPATGVSSVIVAGFTNNCTVSGGSNVIFSGEQLEIGPYRTAYQETVVDDITKFIPYGIVPPSVKDVITLSPSGTGQLNINTAVPGQQLNYNNNTDAITNTINPDINSTSGSYLSTNAVANQQVQGQTVATPQVLNTRYSTTTYNTYSDPGTNPPVSSGLWWLNTVGSLSSSTAIPDGSTISYQASVADASSQIAQIDNLKIAALSTIKVVWQHAPYAGSSVGSTTISFSGSAVGNPPPAQSNQSFSGSSSPNITSQVVNVGNVNQLFNSSVNNNASAQITSATNPVSTPTKFSTTLNDAATAFINNTGSNTFSTSPANNTSTPTITSTVTYNPATNSAVYSDTPNITADFAISSQTSSVNNSANTSVTKNVNNVQNTNNVTNNSTPSITSSINSTTNTVASSGSVYNTSTPTITSNTTFSNVNQTFNDGGSAFSSTPTITRVANATTYHNSLTQGASATYNGTATQTQTPNALTYHNAQNSGTFYFTGSPYIVKENHYVSHNSSFSITDLYTAYQTSRTIRTPDGNEVIMDDNAGNSGTVKSITTGSASAPIDANSQLSLVITSISIPTTPATPVVTISLYDPNNSFVNSTTVSSPQTLTYFNAAAIAGTYTWKVSYNTSGAPSYPTTEFPITLNGTASWFTGSYLYNDVSTEAHTFTTSSATIAPTTPATQLTFTITANTLPSDTYGTSFYRVALLNPDGSSAQIFVGPWTNNQTFTYYNGSATAGAYKWYVVFDVSPNNNGISSYSDSVGGTSYWYEQVADPQTYSYSTTPGPNTLVCSAVSPLATSATTPVTFVLKPESYPTDSAGSSSITVNIIGSVSGSVLTTSFGVAALSNGHSVVVNAAYPAQTWNCYVQAQVASNNSGPTSSYAVSVGVTPSWYQQVADPTTYTYTDNTGSTNTNQTSSTTVAPGASTPLTLAITGVTATSDANGTPGIWIDLYNPAGSIVQSWQTTTAKTITYSTTGAAGIWKWVSYGYIVTDNNINVDSYNVTYTSKATWYQQVSVPTTTYTGHDGTTTNYTTSTDTLAPVSAGTQLSLTISAVSVPGDANGTTSYKVKLLSPSSVLINTWTVSGTQTITYSNASAIGGQYTWNIGGIMATVANTGTGSYSDTLTATTGWFTNVITNTTVYNANAASSQSYNTGTTLAPSSSATQVSFNVTAVTCPSDAQGASSYNITLKDPSGTSIDFNSTAGSSSGGVLNITAPTNCFISTSSLAGVYTWTVQAICTTNNNGTDTYTCSLAATVGWYVQQTSFSTSSSSVTNYSTSSSALSPSVANPLTFSISAISTPSDANSTNSYTIKLFGPASGTIPIQTWTGVNTTTSLSYNTAGPSGTYTWALQAVPNCLNVNSASYTNTLTATLGYYISTATGSYTTHNGAIQAYTTAAAAAPINSARQISISIGSITATSDSHGTSSVTIQLFSPSSSTTPVQTWSNITSTQTLTYSNASAPAGIYTVKIQGVTTNNQNGASSYTTSVNSTLGWYTASTSYTANNGSLQTYTTPSNIVAPTNGTNALTFVIGSISTPSDTYGSTSYTVTLKDPTNTLVFTQSGITATTTLTYSGSAATAGVYTWSVQAIVASNNNGASSYSCSINATNGYWNSNFVNNPGTVHGVSSHATLTLPPASSGAALSFVVTAITVPSDSKGTSFYTAKIIDPNSVVVKTWTGITSTGTFTWFDPSAASGQYLLQVTANVSNTGTGTGRYITSLTSSFNWYQTVTSNVTTYTAIPGDQSLPGASFYTSGTTVAPNASGAQISFVVGVVTAPSDSFGASYYNIVLKDPNHTQIQTWSAVTNGQTLSYYSNTGTAPGGVYQWIVYPNVTPTNTGTSSYNTSLTGTIYWYQSTVQTTNIYTPKDGVASSYHTPSNTIAPAGTATQLSLNLTTINTPANSYGTTTLKVTLQDPVSGAIIASWPASGSTITTPTTFTYSSSAATSGTYTWNIWASALPASGGSAGSTSFLDNWSGIFSWYQPSSVAQGVYIVARDGQTLRSSCNDSDVNFTQLDNSHCQFQITNSASVALPFKLGASSLGI